MTSSEALPTYRELILPVLRAVGAAGGSAQAREITEAVIEAEGFSDEQLELIYPNRKAPKSVLVDRLDWARSYAKLSGALESPRRGFFLLTRLGQEVLSLNDDAARARIIELDNQVRAGRRAALREDSEEVAVKFDEQEDVANEEDEWRDDLLATLHGLSPTGFERFVVALLKNHGLELSMTSAGADEGIDAIGRAPISDVISTRVAVQVKRYDPAKPVGRETVALLQRDSAAAGAEKAILVTLGRFTGPAESAAVATTPTVDLIDGQRLCDLIEATENFGIRTVTVVDHDWYERFDDA
ncbi:MAG: restriction endonuclease [Actinomycetota bacterium]